MQPATHENILDSLSERGFISQCTDSGGLARQLATEACHFYVGVDPTGPSLHVGHLVPLFALIHLARAGHRPIILMGGGTARIGDPSGKSDMRKMLTLGQIVANSAAMRIQIETICRRLGITPRIEDNSDWLANLNYIDFLRDIGRHFSVNRMLSFEAYRTRLERGLSFSEFNYQLLQSYDFLTLYRRHGCLLQIGGDDQWGNIVAGGDLIRRIAGGEVYGLTFPLVTRADGHKMGKTEQGTLFLDPELTDAYSFYHYWRNVPDPDVRRFLLFFTLLSKEEIDALLHGDRNSAKERLAYELSCVVHGEQVAHSSQQAARAAFGGHGDLSSLPRLALDSARIARGLPAAELFAMTDLCGSNSEARRLIQQGGATINGRPVRAFDTLIDTSWLTNKQLLLRAGKKRYFLIKLIG